MKIDRKHRALVTGSVFVGILAAVLAAPQNVAAMPQFARRYGASCSMCHTTVPMLNQVGYNFRRAGFRMPDEVGKDAKFNGLQDMYSARVREQFVVTGAATDGTAANAKVKPTNGFVFNELTFYPITGAIGKYWSSMVEATVGQSGDGVELENAYIKGTFPVNGDLFGTVRAGIFHPYEGFGGSDRTMSNVRPLFQATTVAGVKTWGQDQQGMEIGATYKNTSLTAAVLNGCHGTAAAGLECSQSDPDNNRDFLFFFNQMLGEKAAVSAYYLNGKVNMQEVAPWTNNFNTGAVYANYKVLGDKLDVQGGYQIGKMHLAPVAGVQEAFNHTGWFVNAQSQLHDHFTGALRYDTMDPNTKVGNNRLSAWTVTAAVPFEQIKFLVDYQVKRTQKTLGHDRTDNTLKAEWMVIF